MTRAETVAYNRGLIAVAAIAAASADVLRARLTEAPTRFGFAIGALDGIVEASEAHALPLPPYGGEPADTTLPRPSSGGVAAPDPETSTRCLT